MTSAPHIVRWTDHALEKSHLLGLARADVEDVVLNHHASRTKNTGAADWLVVAGGLTVAYNHPADDDQLVALIVEDDGFARPHRDGSNWPHFAMVDVLAG